MRLLALLLASLIIAVQWPLWFGKGGWLRVWELNQQVSERKAQNAGLRERNGSLEAEVRDLKTGSDAIEERARNELGMVKPDEVFFQVLDKKRHVPSGTGFIQPPASAVTSAPAAEKTLP